MLNQIVIVGRLVKDLEIVETESGKKTCHLTIAVPRSYKNTNGDYDTDFIDCILWSGVAENTVQYCRKGDLLGIKGRVQKGNEDKEMIVVAEKVTFLSSKRSDEKDGQVESEEE